MGHFNLNGVSIDLNRFVSGEVIETKSGFYVKVVLRGTFLNTTVKCPVFGFRDDANKALSDLLISVNKK